MTRKNKSVYTFEEGDGKNKMLLGGKGANLCEMTQIGLNVPPGFVITTETCLKHLDDKENLPEGVMDAVRKNMVALEEKTIRAHLPAEKGTFSSGTPIEIVLPKKYLFVVEE